MVDVPQREAPVARDPGHLDRRPDQEDHADVLGDLLDVVAHDEPDPLVPRGHEQALHDLEAEPGGEHQHDAPDQQRAGTGVDPDGERHHRRGDAQAGEHPRDQPVEREVAGLGDHETTQLLGALVQLALVVQREEGEHGRGDEPVRGAGRPGVPRRHERREVGECRGGEQRHAPPRGQVVLDEQVDVEAHVAQQGMGGVGEHEPEAEQGQRRAHPAEPPPDRGEAYRHAVADADGLAVPHLQRVRAAGQGERTQRRGQHQRGTDVLTQLPEMRDEHRCELRTGAPAEQRRDELPAHRRHQEQHTTAHEQAARPGAHPSRQHDQYRGDHRYEDRRHREPVPGERALPEHETADPGEPAVHPAELRQRERPDDHRTREPGPRPGHRAGTGGRAGDRERERDHEQQRRTPPGRQGVLAEHVEPECELVARVPVRIGHRDGETHGGEDRRDHQDLSDRPER